MTAIVLAMLFSLFGCFSWAWAIVDPIGAATAFAMLDVSDILAFMIIGSMALLLSKPHVS